MSATQRDDFSLEVSEPYRILFVSASERNSGRILSHDVPPTLVDDELREAEHLGVPVAVRDDPGGRVLRRERRVKNRICDGGILAFVQRLTLMPR